jgi:hypothetical protein
MQNLVGAAAYNGNVHLPALLPSFGLTSRGHFLRRVAVE